MGTTQTRGLSSLWSRVPMGPPDPILGVTEAFRADSHASKINLGVGAYRDNLGKPYILKSVRKAEELLLSHNANHEYCPIQGIAEFNSASIKLAYGSTSPLLQQGRIAVAQSISGTGALRLGGAFLNKFYRPEGEKPQIYLPQPTWSNHFSVFQESGHSTTTYRYYSPQTKGLDFEGLIADIKSAPEGSIFVFHACAHNPTGVDPTAAQWEAISAAALQKKHVCFFDMAYQGFASGCPEKDASAVRLFAANGHSLLLAQSYAKNFGLYGERAGALSIVVSGAEERERVESQLKLIIRPMYSNPPIHGARIVASILGDDALAAEWRQEVGDMARRIIGMREALRSKLEALGSVRDWKHITEQIGMFCYTGLDAEQVQRLVQEFHVYLTRDGRISIAGINSGNVEYLARAIHAVTK